MKVREYGFRRMDCEQFAQGIDLVPLEAGAAHSGIDRELPREARRQPLLEGRLVGERRRQTRANGGVEVTGQQWSEDDDRPRDRSGAELFAFNRRSNAEAPRIELVEQARDTHGAESVRVRLDHWQQRYAGMGGERPGVS